MRVLAQLLVFLVATIHVGILILEMFFWDHDIGRKIFSMTPEVSSLSAVLAANQGLYNGFLAAGLFYGLFTKNRQFLIFFLVCVVVAGVYGAATAKVTILFSQAAPAAFALIFVLASRLYLNRGDLLR
ncbi:MAG: DUF1304 domain-containing protein [Pseudomonadota bacterium]